jgi:hypothetical protein
MRVATPVSRLAKARGQAYAVLDRARSSAASACRNLVCRRHACRPCMGGDTASCTRWRLAPHYGAEASSSRCTPRRVGTEVQPSHNGHRNGHDSNSSREALTPAAYAFKHRQVGRTMTCSASDNLSAHFTFKDTSRTLLNTQNLGPFHVCGLAARGYHRRNSVVCIDCMISASHTVRCSLFYIHLRGLCGRRCRSFAGCEA